VRYFAEKEEFRQSKADQQEAWEGNKNECYAQSLARMGEYFSELQDEDPILKKLVAHYSELMFEDEVFSLPKSDLFGCSEADEEAIHCGTRGLVMSQTDCADWFAGWVDVVIRQLGAERKRASHGE
jgi:hypothetical protein